MSDLIKAGEIRLFGTIVKDQIHLARGHGPFFCSDGG